MKVALAAAGLIGGIVGGLAVWIAQKGSLSLLPSAMSYENFVSIMLTGVTVLLAVAALGIGAMAFWGWTTFKGITVDAAGSAALAHLQSDDGAGAIRVVIQRIAVGFLQENLRNGTLLALAEQRNREEDQLREVDEDWGAVEIQEPRHGE